MSEETNQPLIVMKELSDIKEKLAFNTSKTDNIDKSVARIETDIRDIKNSAVTRTEFGETIKVNDDHEARLRKVEGYVGKAIGALIICQIIVLPVVLFLVYQALTKK